MPIYEFFCDECNTIFNFFSRAVNTSKTPKCPQCRRKLKRQVSRFAAARRGGGGDDEAGGGEGGDLPIDDARMERAMESLAGDAESIDENDPRQAAQLMRKFSRMTGMEFGEGMETALSRMEAGEDPEKIEEEMGDAIEKEEPFVAGGGGKKARGNRARPAPRHDATLYDL